MRLYSAYFDTFYPAPILEYLATGYADRTEEFSETGSAETVHDLILDYVPKQDGIFTFTENALPVTVIPWGEVPTTKQISVDFDTGRMKFYGQLYLLSCTYTPLGSCLTQPLAEWLRSASAGGYQHSAVTGNPHGVTLQHVTGGSFGMAAGEIVSVSQELSISSNGDITTTGEITAGSIFGELFGNLNGSTTVGTTGLLATVTTRNANAYGRTTMDGSTLYQSLRDIFADDTTYYHQTCSTSGLPEILRKTPADSVPVNVGSPYFTGTHWGVSSNTPLAKLTVTPPANTSFASMDYINPTGSARANEISFVSTAVSRAVFPSAFVSGAIYRISAGVRFYQAEGGTAGTHTLYLYLMPYTAAHFGQWARTVTTSASDAWQLIDLTFKVVNFSATQFALVVNANGGGRPDYHVIPKTAVPEFYFGFGAASGNTYGTHITVHTSHLEAYQIK